MNKKVIVGNILNALEAGLVAAVKASDQAHETATHSENKAENKFDTLGLEAAYLAHGQSQRVLECEAEIASFKLILESPFQEDTAAELGSLVQLEDSRGQKRSVYIGPCSGGVRVRVGESDIVVVTPQAPLCKVLLGKMEGDEIEFGQVLEVIIEII
ncbi:MAG: transcription elongation factor GreAB [Pseudomonadales bacterium]